MNTSKVSFSIEEHRTDFNCPYWDLPPWGHPLSQCVMPLFMEVDSHFFPIGTAFAVGKGVCFLLTAMHNIREAYRHEPHLAHLLTSDHLPAAISSKRVSFSVLYQRQKNKEPSSFDLMLWPFETFNGAPPTDLVIGSAQFQSSYPVMLFKLSFDTPRRGEKIFSVGYCDFHYPKEGISREKVISGEFNWHSEYGHTFRVIEGCVDRIFTQRFSKFVEGPCFTFSAEIFHGQSGGPVLDENGLVRGINSAGATSFFPDPTSIASLLYPLFLVKVDTGVQMAPNFRFNASLPLLEWIANGAIPTDGSEQYLSIRPTEDGFAVGCRAPLDMAAFTHDDFAGYQAGRTATKNKNVQLYRVKYHDGRSKTDSE